MKKGRYKHYVDALMAKFLGYPDGLTLNRIKPSDIAFNLLDDIPGDEVLNQVCRKLKEWLNEEIKKDGADVRSASFTMRIIGHGVEDVRETAYQETIGIERDAGGTAYPIRKKLSSKEDAALKQAPYTDFEVTITMEASGEIYSKTEKIHYQ